MTRNYIESRNAGFWLRWLQVIFASSSSCCCCCCCFATGGAGGGGGSSRAACLGGGAAPSPQPPSSFEIFGIKFYDRHAFVMFLLFFLVVCDIVHRL